MAEQEMKEVLQRLSALEAKAKVTEDLEQIKRLTERLINAHYNMSNVEEELNCYSEEAVLDTGAVLAGAKPLKGKAQIAEFLKPRLPKDIPPMAMPTKMASFLVHPHITLDGDKAKGNWLLYHMYCFTTTYQSLYWTQYVGELEYVKENGQWKVSYTKMAPRIGPPHPKRE